MRPSVADIDGPWVEPDRGSGLIDRLRRWWNVPVPDLPDEALAMFLRQQVAVDVVLAEARRRLSAEQPDGSELYDGQLAAAVQEAEARRERSR